MSVKSALSTAAVLLAGGVALTACHAGTGPPAAAHSAPAVPRTPTVSAPASASATPVPKSAPPTPSTPTLSAPARRPSAPATTPAPRHSPGGGEATSDSYAWKHPCATRQLSIHVVTRAAAPSQRVIEVRNTGAASCGLSYYPLVDLYNGESANGGVNVVPLVPDGLGGPPAFPLYAGRTSYAVLDLDPSGATTGTADGVDQMNLRADAHIPSRETKVIRLGDGVHVLKPKLGLYRSNVADAVDSMRSADMEP